MPRAAQLADRRFGKLTVERLATSAENPYPGLRAWRCRCACGAVLYHTSYNLTSGRYDACPDCGGPRPDRKFPRICVVCGAEFPGDPKALVCSNECRKARRRAVAAGIPEAGGLPGPTRNCIQCGRPFPFVHNRRVCSPECLLAKQRRRFRESYYRRVAKDPDLAVRQYRRLRERTKTDPAAAEMLREYDRRRHAKHRQRMQSDPEYAAQSREWANAHYREHRDEIQARRRERLLAMPPPELDAWMTRMRGYTRKYRRKFQAELEADPERHRRYLDLQREYQAQRFRLKTLLEAGRLESEIQERTP